MEYSSGVLDTRTFLFKAVCAAVCILPVLRSTVNMENGESTEKAPLF
jgi:uncharacterized protein (DUF169 family)